MLGAYVLFIGMATAVMSFIDAGGVDFSYPKLVFAARAREVDIFVKELKKTKISILMLGGVLIGLCAFCGGRIIGKTVYAENLYILCWLLLSTALSFLSVIPHLGLYALNEDQAIFRSQVFGFVVFSFSLLFPIRSVCSRSCFI